MGRIVKATVEVPAELYCEIEGVAALSLLTLEDWRPRVLEREVGAAGPAAGGRDPLPQADAFGLELQRLAADGSGRSLARAARCPGRDARARPRPGRMIVGASIRVAAVLEQNVHRHIGQAFLERFAPAGRKASVPLLAWAEIAGAIARRTGDAASATRAVGFFGAQPWVRGVPLDAGLAGEATRVAAGLRLRGADAVDVALASLRREPLLTPDREMIERAGDVVQVLAPER